MRELEDLGVFNETEEVNLSFLSSEISVILCVNYTAIKKNMYIYLLPFRG